MIVEVRTYKLKPGQRDRFVQFFAATVSPAQRSHGIEILGPLLDLEDADAFVFLRSFPTLAAREEMMAAFYASSVWKNEIEGFVKPMIDTSSVALTEGERITPLPPLPAALES
jgi:hypothetical protein